MSAPLDLDRMIEEGLSLYGRGDLDGALLVWEQVLAVDPDNEQANSYVDYVRMNYEMLTADGGAEEAAPFGIAADDEPEYQIEISEGELPPPRPSAPMYMDPSDAGWMIEDEVMRPKAGGSTFDDAHTGAGAASEPSNEASNEPIELELEADEPPEPELPTDLLDGLPTPPSASKAVAAPVPRATTANEVSFDDATLEYEGPRGAVKRDRGDPTPEPVANEFTPEGTPGFGASSHQTDVKKRDFGFVKPSAAPRAEPPELKMTLRTPDFPRSAHEDPTKEEMLQKRASEFERSYNAAERRGDIDHLPTGEHAPLAPIEPDDLIASLPSPKPAHTTRDLPPPTVKPATTPPPFGPAPPAKRPTAVQAAIDSIDLEAPEPELPVSSSAPTRDFTDKQGDGLHISFNPPAEALKDTRDFGERPTKETRRPAEVDAPMDPLISAPTRELGLRPHGRAPTEDEPTLMNKQIRPDRDRPTEPARPAPAGTRADIVLPFDPIDARATQILDEIDADVPADESKDDRTRRRITTLLERATLWSSVDLDRAVAAVDLALSEDPNSALAQKLIHRNREAIMGVFQAFLGDLDRQPELARPLHELATAPISPRAAFLLSRVDGTLSLDEILDVSGMPRLEAYRYLCQLFLRGILR